MEATKLIDGFQSTTSEMDFDARDLAGLEPGHFINVRQILRGLGNATKGQRMSAELSADATVDEGQACARLLFLG